MNFLDVFTPIVKGNFALTEELIYNSIQYDDGFIPVWGGNKDHSIIDRNVSIHGRTKKGKPVKIFTGEGIIISLDGSAGNMTYKKQDERFALNHHAGFFKIKDATKIIPEFFTLFYERQLKEISVSDGSKTLTTKQIYKEDFEIPCAEEQRVIMKTVKPLLKIKDNTLSILQKIRKLKQMTFSHTYSQFQIKDEKISNMMKYSGGNSGLTEQQIYQKISTDENKYTVLSSSIKNDMCLGEIPLCTINGRPLKVFEGKDGILVTRIGNAGNSRYLKNGAYAITENAYVLYLQDNLKFDVNLKWLLHELKSIIFEYSPHADYGAWNMSEFYKTAKINIPILKEQTQIVTEFQKLEKIERTMRFNLKKINILLQKNIVMA